mmetsp:Transcript_11688/g.21394  ORF Transcript_11688/g.21394 Transcript_11688/m.21394 type:complete len:351 (+) Transcript_11688:68-1120(+)|eukprot:CAMPEP_0197529356 /NCGR_PEP_ID=MMETSP1318-20131121/28144_1 /TAXON_ID=552666 /ORGANISM="Partenskyella glossopodia, Strain RCC365" /LENGTH=350 /DNA_ID=CAMNT_0043084789 /DNA_START=16 /DNA_END=1068 /DNA_ORIENTATION=-
MTHTAATCLIFATLAFAMRTEIRGNSTALDAASDSGDRGTFDMFMELNEEDMELSEEEQRLALETHTNSTTGETVQPISAKHLVRHYGHCKIETVKLGWSSIQENPLLSKEAIKEATAKLRAMQLIKVNERIKHCFLLFEFGKQKDCRRIVIEHNAAINGWEWGTYLRSKLVSRKEMGFSWVWNLKRGTFPTEKKDAWKDIDAGFHENGEGPSTIFNLMHEIFLRDPNIQAYDIKDRNCCFFAKSAMQILTEHEHGSQDHQLLDNVFQNSKSINAVLRQMFPSTYNMKKGLVRMFGGGPTPDFKKLSAVKKDEAVKARIMEEASVDILQHMVSNRIIDSNNKKLFGGGAL